MAKKSNPESNPDIQDAFPKIGTPLDPEGESKKSRRVKLTSQDINVVCREIRLLADEIGAVAARMDRKDISAIISDGAQRWRRAGVMLKNFIRTCRSGLIDAEHGIALYTNDTPKHS